MKNCRICGKLFLRNSNRQVLCSVGCKRENKRRYRKTEKCRKKTRECDRKYWYSDKRQEWIASYRKTEEYIEGKKEIDKKYRKSDKYKLWYDNNWRKYYDKRRESLYYCINDAMSTAVYHSLKGNKNGRSWENLVGYNAEELKNHLEIQFEDWMTWENYGKVEEGKKKWHIDHIIPKSHFKYETAEDSEFKKCWALENLQPLEAIENIKKGNKVRAQGLLGSR